MSPEMKLLRAFIDECGMDIKDLPDGEFKVTRRQKKKRTSKEIAYTPEFMQIWAHYPKRAGNNSKVAAFKAYQARIQENKGNIPDDIFIADIMAGVKRYAAFIQATDKTNTEYVLMGSTFFGSQKHYLADWEPPKKKYNKEEREIRIQELKKQPWAKMPGTLNLAELRSFAIEHGYNQPGQITDIDGMTQYKRQLKDQIDARIEKEL